MVVRAGTVLPCPNAPDGPVLRHLVLPDFALYGPPPPPPVGPILAIHTISKWLSPITHSANQLKFPTMECFDQA